MRDVPLEVAPIILSDGAERAADPITALGLLEECKRVHAPYEAEVYPQAHLNERFMHGDQIVKAVGRDEHIVDENVLWPSWLTPISRNLLRNPALTWGARVTERDPVTSCWPGEGGAADVAAATVADRVLGYYRQKLDLRQQMSRAAWMVQEHGTVGWRIFWDPDAGPKGELDDGQMVPLGDVVYELVSIFDFAIDPVDNLDDAAWCFFRRWKSRADARRLLLAAGIMDEPAVGQSQSTWTRRTDLVECIELYVKPNTDARFPDGLVVQVVGGNVLAVEPFPYAHVELPIAIWKCSTKAGYPYGDTHVSDAVPLQNNYNKLHAAMTVITAKSARWLKVFLPKSMKAAFDGGDEAIFFDPSEDPRKVHIVSAPPPSPLLVAQIEEHERMIDKVFGVNEAIVGSDASQSKNARHLAYLSQLDAQKQKEARVDLEHAVLRVERQALRLTQQFVDSERIVRLVGDQGRFEEVAFRGADLEGVDVILETAPLADQSRAASAADSEQAAAAGLEDPQRARELRRTGVSETRYEALSRRAVQAQAKQAMQGLAVQPDPMVPPEVAVAELQLQLQQAPPLAVAPLQALLAAYVEIARTQGQPSPDGAVDPVMQPPPPPGTLE